MFKVLSFVADEKTYDDNDSVPYEAVPLDSATVRSVRTVIPLRHLVASKAAGFIAAWRQAVRDQHVWVDNTLRLAAAARDR